MSRIWRISNLRSLRSAHTCFFDLLSSDRHLWFRFSKLSILISYHTMVCSARSHLKLFSYSVIVFTWHQMVWRIVIEQKSIVWVIIPWALWIFSIPYHLCTLQDTGNTYKDCGFFPVRLLFISWRIICIWQLSFNCSLVVISLVKIFAWRKWPFALINDFWLSNNINALNRLMI